MCLTGATGYLAANFLNYSYDSLKNAYNKIFLLDRNLKLERLEKRILASEDTLVKSFDIVSEDISSCEFLFENFESVDFIHFAYTANLEKEKEFLVRLKSAMLSSSIELNFFFISSAAVYGEQKEIPTSELAPLKPIGSYGAFKKDLEEFILEEFSRCLILRLANPYAKSLG